MADRPSTTAGRRPSTTALAILITFTLLAFLGLGWLWYTSYAPVHYDFGGSATITAAANARYIIPGIFAGIVLVAAAWLIAWVVARWEITFLPIAIGTFGLLALIFFGIELRNSLTNQHDISVLVYTCDAEAERMGASTDRIPEGCNDMFPSRATVTIGTSNDPGMFRRDDRASSIQRFPELPEGTYTALLTTTTRPDIAEVALAAETRNGIRPVAPLRHNSDDTWSSPIPLHPDLEDYYLLLYRSPYEEAPEARIRLTVQECIGTSLANFDASACEPARITAPIVEEVPPSGDTGRGRPIAVDIDGDTMDVTNLEERAYTFTPSISGVTGTNILVIPADVPQVSDENLMETGGNALEGTFTVEITRDTGDLEYIVYVVRQDPTYATISTSVRPLTI